MPERQEVQQLEVQVQPQAQALQLAGLRGLRGLRVDPLLAVLRLRGDLWPEAHRYSDQPWALRDWLLARRAL